MGIKSAAEEEEDEEDKHEESVERFDVVQFRNDVSKVKFLLSLIDRRLFVSSPLHVAMIILIIASSKESEIIFLPIKKKMINHLFSLF